MLLSIILATPDELRYIIIREGFEVMSSFVSLNEKCKLEMSDGENDDWRMMISIAQIGISKWRVRLLQ